MRSALLPLTALSLLQYDPSAEPEPEIEAEAAGGGSDEEEEEDDDGAAAVAAGGGGDETEEERKARRKKEKKEKRKAEEKAAGGGDETEEERKARRKKEKKEKRKAEEEGGGGEGGDGLPGGMDMDGMVEYCYLACVTGSVKDSDLPMPVSTFYAQMLKCRPAGSNVDLKKSSYKKIAKFITVMAKVRTLSRVPRILDPQTSCIQRFS